MIDRKGFFDRVRNLLFGGSLSSDQVKGIEAILDGWVKAAPIIGSTDLRWLAYCLATTFHETARTMQPIEEYGHGKGHAYGVPAGPWHQIYDGRGDVQLTWFQNYVKADDRLHALGLIDANLDLAKDPSLARRIDIAVMVLIVGCAEGWFTCKKLGDYFNATTENPVGARHIVNGSDRANVIAQYYTLFTGALKASQLPDAPAQATPQPQKAVPTHVDTPKPEPTQKPPAIAPAAVSKTPTSGFSAWLRSLVVPPPVGNRSPLGDTNMFKIDPNIFSIAGVAGSLGVLLPQIPALYSNYGLIAVGVLVLCFIVQMAIPAGVATKVEDVVIGSIIPTAEALDPALKPTLEMVSAGIKAAQSAGAKST